MQAVLNKVENTNSIHHFLSRLEADNSTKNEVENMLVSFGSAVVPELVNQLQIVRGIKRGVVAMSLIRIGDASIEALQNAAENNEDFAWVAQYLISEINGSIAA